MIRSLLFTSGFLLLFIMPAFAQTQLVFQEKQNKSYLFKYNQSQNLNEEVNHIIRKLAESTGKGIYRTEYIFNFEQLARITREGSTLKISIEHQDLYCTGDANYKGFPIGELLIPGKVALKVHLLNGQNHTVKTFTFNDINIIDGSAEMALANYPDTTGQNFKLSVSSSFFSYGILQMNEFNERLFVINDYYATDAQLNLAFQNLQLVNPGDIDNLPMHNAALQKVELNINQVESKNFPGKLSLSFNDPAQLMAKLNGIKQEAVNKRMAINQVYATLDAIYYNKGLEFLVNNNTVQAENYFEKSVSVNPFFAPANLQLAKMEFKKGNIQPAEKRLKDILFVMNPDVNTRQIAIEMLGEIYQIYIDDAAYFNQKGEYNEANNIYQKAKTLCSSIPGMVCSEELFRGMAMAKKGIYHGYLNEATIALQKRDLEKAEKLIADAKNYQKNNSTEIHHAEEAETLLKEVKYQRYINLIENGKKLLSQQQYDNALKEFNAALSLEKSYSLNPSKELPLLKKQAAKPLILQKIESGEREVKSNNLLLARKHFRDAEAMQNSYELKEDNDINNKLNKLKAKILTQECVNAQSKFDDFYAKGMKAKAAGDYLTAGKHFDGAERIANENKDCGISTTALKDDAMQIIPAETYLKLLIIVNDLHQNNKYQAAIEKYKECDKYYYQFDVKNFGIEHQQVPDYIMSKGQNGFLAYAADYYLNLKDYEKVLTFHKTLIQRNYPVNYLKKSQSALGIQLAIRDKTANPSGNPKLLVLQYTDGNKKLKALHKSYLKQWKKM